METTDASASSRPRDKGRATLWESTLLGGHKGRDRHFLVECREEAQLRYTLLPRIQSSPRPTGTKTGCASRLPGSSTYPITQPQVMRMNSWPSGRDWSYEAA